ncbi:MAG: anthranilate phosphoribosyltransferase [Thermococcaceae archaeon]|jgi:anthranilate phosphoribosyltransferase|uniref:anthranilate phosphoribosyltransferase n=1 Tax=Thermococcus sp. PK TaxID=913025 RepID=UPI0005B2E55A|nr:anthranilate phosphoribosyltransferase [Thermococcus sp. PK]MDK2853150.1 anthranilate phosphoribosyltransferase [Thermococcaceae archaeon]MDN5319593.1 anthranilate phosphoribosyltransferase [Thermococcaceae archaeon]
MIEEVIKGLDFEKAYELSRSLPELDEIQIAAILGAMEGKGYDAEIIAGFAKGIAEKSRIDLGRVADTCGTGGDGSATINVSTAVALALSTIHPVAKHGNRAISSNSGSADVLEAMGINIEMNESVAKKMIKDVGFAFLFAPLYHKSFARVVSVRRKLGIRTIFNILGPLTNPANPKVQIVGVANEGLLSKVAEALSLLNRRALVVHGSGMDEVSPSNKTTALLVDKDSIERIILLPEDFGVKRTKVIPCYGKEESAERIRAVFNGKGYEEDRTFIGINFAAALYAIGHEDLKENMEIFKEKLESGAFSKKLEEIACKSTSMSVR